MNLDSVFTSISFHPTRRIHLEGNICPVCTHFSHSAAYDKLQNFTCRRNYYIQCNLKLVITGMQKFHKTKMNEMETLRIHEDEKNYQANSCPSRVSATENCDPQNTRTTPKLCNLSITLGAL